MTRRGKKLSKNATPPRNPSAVNRIDQFLKNRKLKIPDVACKETSDAVCPDHTIDNWDSHTHYRARADYTHHFSNDPLFEWITDLVFALGYKQPDAIRAVTSVANKARVE
jgi:hypothetical protein